MKREYEIKKLHCAGCASKIQYELDKLEDIKDVNVDFYSKKLKFTLLEKEKEKEIFDRVNIVMDKVEPGTYIEKEEIISKLENRDDHNHEHGHFENSKIETMILTIGITLFVVGLTLDASLQKTIILLLAYILSGYDIVILALKNIRKGKILDENFLMSIATIGALMLGDFGEAAGVMIFYKIGEFFQEMAVNNSRKSIQNLMSIKPEFANLKTKSGLDKVSPEAVKVGDTIVVKAGERVPLDGVVTEGTTTLDTSALTGESVPRLVEKDDEVLSGSINLNGLLEMRVTKLYSQSAVSRIIDMVENAGNKKAEAEKFITKFARYYTPIVVGLALIIGLIVPLFIPGGFKLWLSRALIFLVISCPCALVISVPLTFFSSIGKGSKNGILIKGGNYLERLKNIDVVVFDKTGTLTEGKFEVSKVETFSNVSEETLLEYAKAGEYYSNHPIAKAIMNYGEVEIVEWDIQGHNEKIGYGTNTLYLGKEILVGNEKYMKEHGVIVPKNGDYGTLVYVTVDSVLYGKIVVRDKIKESSSRTITELRYLGIESYMLTGDNKNTGEKIASEIGIDPDKVYTQLLPQDKVSKFEEIKKRCKKGVVFVGDGINDAPALALADVGISMGEIGSDIAIESSDIVIMKDEPYKVLEALKLATLNNKVVLENISFALGVKIVVMVLGVLGIANLWLAIFADVGVSVLAVLNASKILKSKKERS